MTTFFFGGGGGFGVSTQPHSKKVNKKSNTKELRLLTHLFFKISYLNNTMTYSKDRTIFFSFKQKKDATSVTSFTEALACPTQRHKKVRPLLDAASLQVLGL